MDYRVRGFTRDVKGKKHYIDHKINSIQDYLAKASSSATRCSTSTCTRKTCSTRRCT
jgi:hypothetical protein